MIKKLLLISFVWGIIIFVLSSIPGNSLPSHPTIPHFDKIVHAGLYFILSLFILPVLDFSEHKWVRKSSFLIVILITSLYGGFIEIAQQSWFVNRSGELGDFLSDIAGSLIGIILYYSLLRKVLARFYDRFQR